MTGWGNGTEVILTLADVHMLGIDEIENIKDGEIAVICPNCFREIISYFQAHHNERYFKDWCKNREEIKL